MNIIRRTLFSASMLMFAAIGAGAVAIAPMQASAAEIAYIVNKVPVTSYDIQKRVAFMRLLQRRGNLRQLATDDMIDQVLHLQEMKRLRIDISNQQVTDAYERFAKSNKMSLRQLDGILAQTGVTKDHFREYIRAQMGWGKAVQARASAGGQNAKDAVREMMKDGEKKPSATEYILQQVILVVPERDRRSLMGKRRNEAQSLRKQFGGCENSRDKVKGMLDVTIRDLGRVLEPELPPDWAKQVKATPVGGATAPHDTERGVEFLVVCSTRVATDDKVAELLYQQEKLKEGAGDEDALSKTYTAELREKAQIVKR